MVFARKPDGTWRICYSEDYQGLNAISWQAVEPLPHIDALLSSYHQLRARASDRWMTSFRLQLGQFEWNVVQFGWKDSLLLLMRAMNEALIFGFPS